jgi:hypothetical protein
MVDVDEKQLLELYVSGERVVNIARILGVSTTTIFNRLNKCGIREKVKSKKREFKKDSQVGKPKIDNHKLNFCELEFLKEMKHYKYPETRIAYMLGMDLEFLQENGYL